MKSETPAAFSIVTALWRKLWNEISLASRAWLRPLPVLLCPRGNAVGFELPILRVGFQTTDCYSVECTGLINSRGIREPILYFSISSALGPGSFSPPLLSGGFLESRSKSRALSISRSQTVGSGYCTLATCDNDHQRGSSPVGSGVLYYIAFSRRIIESCADGTIIVIIMNLWNCRFFVTREND